MCVCIYIYIYIYIEDLLVQYDWLLKVRRHLEKYEKILRQRKLKTLKKLTKSNEFLFFECLGQFDSQEPFFLFKHQFFKFVIRLYLILRIPITLYI